MSQNPDIFDSNKLDQLILYVALSHERANRFGRVKLAKVLFFADFAAYSKLGRPITGATYQKREFGPCPAQLPEAEARLQTTRRAHERVVPAGRFQQRRLLALEAPDLTVFSADEIAIVDDVIQTYWEDSAADVSEYSHRFPGWRLLKLGDSIPYFSALIPERPAVLSADELQRAKDKLAEIFPRS